MLSIVNHQSVSLLQSLLLGHPRSSHQQLPQNGLVPVLSLGDAGQSVLMLRDDENVNRGNWGDVPEGKDELVLEHHLRRDLLSHQFIKDRLLCHP
jgi:hypothetical protein